MSDRWFEELVQVTKEQEAQERLALDERWDRLAAGTLDADAAAGLRAEAEQTAEGRAAWEAFRPLEADFQSRIVASVKAQQAAERAPPTQVLPFRSRVPYFAAAGLLAAGLAAFALLRPFLSPALPAYTHSVNAGYRGGETIVIGQKATVSLQPKAASRGRVAVQCVLTPTGEAPKFWSGCESHRDHQPDGTLRVTLPPAATAELRPGILRVLVGRPDRFPPPAETAARDPQGRWQAFEVEVSPPPP